MVVELVQLLLWVLSLASIVYYCAAIAAAHRFFSQGPEESSSPSTLPPVTILIPLCGADHRAYENYASLCRQDYPSLQLIFGVLNPDDSSIPVVARLRRDFADLDIELVVDTSTLGNNPKVSNLHNMLKRARHEILVLMDSDVRVRPGFLRRVVPSVLDRRVGLATCLYRGSEAPGLTSRLESIGIAAEFVPGVLTAWWTEGMSFALGATVIMRHEKLAAIGGFEAIADYLADDYMLGRLMRQAGYPVRLLPEVVETVLSEVSFSELLAHQVRWSRGIRACRPGGHLGLIFTHGVVMALANCLLSGGTPASVLLFLTTMSIRSWMGWFVGGRHLGDPLLAKSFMLLPVRDLFAFLVWCLSLAGCTVEWRGKSYRILQGGKLAVEAADRPV
jgi:ceramide glucosyltransferase